MLDIAPSSVTEESASPRARRKVAIVGTAPNSAAAPFSDPSWEVWGVGFRGAHVTRATRWYEVHQLGLNKDGEDWIPLLKAWAGDATIHMLLPDPRLAEIKDRIRMIRANAATGGLLSKHDARWFSSSFAWMIGDAIYAHELYSEEPVSEIGVWGVDMEGGTEYEEQRTGFFFFKEVARMRGIELRVVTSGGLAHVNPLPYPFCNDDPVAEKLKLKRTLIEKEKATFEAAAQDSRDRLNFLSGQIAVLERADQETEEIAKLKAERSVHERAIGAANTALVEIKAWLECLAWMRAYFKG